MRHDPIRAYAAATIEQIEAVVAAADAFQRARCEAWHRRLADRTGYRLGDPGMYAVASAESSLIQALGRCPGTHAFDEYRAEREEVEGMAVVDNGII